MTHLEPNKASGVKMGQTLWKQQVDDIQVDETTSYDAGQGRPGIVGGPNERQGDESRRRREGNRVRQAWQMTMTHAAQQQGHKMG